MVPCELRLWCSGGSYAAGHGGDVETTLSQISRAFLFRAASKTVIEIPAGLGQPEGT